MLGLTVLMLLEPAGFVLGSVTEAPSATPAGLWWPAACRLLPPVPARCGCILSRCTHGPVVCLQWFIQFAQLAPSSYAYVSPQPRRCPKTSWIRAVLSVKYGGAIRR